MRSQGTVEDSETIHSTFIRRWGIKDAESNIKPDFDKKG